MLGQKKFYEADPHQEIVDRFIEENNPYEPSQPLDIDLRKYLQYAAEHNIRDISTLSDDVISQFMIRRKPELVSSQEATYCSA